LMSKSSDMHEIILAGDIGGTNANFALVSRRESAFTIEAETRIASDSITDFTATTIEARSHLAPGIKLDRCCICAAGLVRNNSCSMTNQEWVVDGDGLAAALSLPTVVINDFLALSYALPLLDINDPAQIQPLQHPDGSLPLPSGNSYSIIGAGTGLGLGHLIQQGTRFTAIPSEGGHTDFPAFDRDTRKLGEFLAPRYDAWPGMECLLSGRGIVNIYAYVRDSMTGPPDSTLEEIDALEEKDRPAAIARHGLHNPHCRRTMELFTRIYGKFAGNTALNFLPRRGLFLAGGIAQKNLDFLLTEDRFMRYFESNYNPKLRELLRTIPVYLIRNYNTSLLGAAHAATLLLD